MPSNYSRLTDANVEPLLAHLRAAIERNQPHEYALCEDGAALSISAAAENLSAIEEATREGFGQWRIVDVVYNEDDDELVCSHTYDIIPTLNGANVHTYKGTCSHCGGSGFADVEGVVDAYTVRLWDRPQCVHALILQSASDTYVTCARCGGTGVDCPVSDLLAVMDALVAYEEAQPDDVMRELVSPRNAMKSAKMVVELVTKSRSHRVRLSDHEVRRVLVLYTKTAAKVVHALGGAT